LHRFGLNLPPDRPLIGMTTRFFERKASTWWKTFSMI